MFTCALRVYNRKCYILVVLCYIYSAVLGSVSRTRLLALAFVCAGLAHPHSRWLTLDGSSFAGSAACAHSRLLATCTIIHSRLHATLLHLVLASICAVIL